MSDLLLSVETRAAKIAENWGLLLTNLLGHGIDGNVWQTNRLTALKLFSRHDTYVRERDCYRRLLEHKIQQLVGFMVP